MIYRDIEDVGHKDTKIHEANVGRDDLIGWYMLHILLGWFGAPAGI